MRKPTPYDIEKVSSLEYTRKELTHVLNCSTTFIDSICKNNKIVLDKGPRPSKGINHGFFRKITKESAYLLGFIAADGCVFTVGGSKALGIYLAQKDEEHLENIKNFIAPGKKLYRSHSSFNGKKYPTIKLNVYSKEIYNSLLDLGITERKSLTLKWFDIPEEFISHYVRGYFDGDGCVYLREQGNYRKVTVSMLGTFDFLTHLAEKCPVTYSSFTKVGNIYELSYSRKNNSKDFLEWIYADSNELIRLRRKYEKYINNIYLNKYIYKKL